MSPSHDLYRVFQIPGLRRSYYYGGTGIEQTYNMAATDHDFPDHPEAVPALREVDVGDNCTKHVMGKDVEHKVLVCPKCETVGRQEPSGEKFCPECGLILGRGDARGVENHEPFGVDGQPIDRSPSAAGRFDE